MLIGCSFQDIKGRITLQILQQYVLMKNTGLGQSGQLCDKDPEEIYEYAKDYIFPLSPYNFTWKGLYLNHYK